MMIGHKVKECFLFKSSIGSGELQEKWNEKRLFECPQSAISPAEGSIWNQHKMVGRQIYSHRHQVIPSAQTESRKLNLAIDGSVEAAKTGGW